MTALLASLLLFVSMAEAQERSEGEQTRGADDLDRLEGRMGAFVRARFGFVGTPYPAPESPEARGRAATTIVQATSSVSAEPSDNSEVRSEAPGRCRLASAKRTANERSSPERASRLRAARRMARTMISSMSNNSATSTA